MARGLLAGVLVLVGGCQASSFELPPGSGSKPEAPEGSEAAIAVFAQEGADLRLLSFSPASGVFTPFGPPLSGEDAGELAYAEVSVPTRRALVTFRRAEVRSALYAGDGRGWERLAEAPELQTSFSNNLSLAWITSGWAPRTSEASQSVLLWHAERGPLLERPREAKQVSARLLTFGPTSEWLLYLGHPEGLRLRFLDGRERPMLASLTPYLTFAESVVSLKEGTLRWLDLYGDDLERPGFSGDWAHVSRAGYQVVDGELSQLTDDGVRFLQRVPVGTRASDVLAHREGQFVVLRRGTSLVVHGVDGAPLVQREAAQLPGQTRANVSGGSLRATATGYRMFVITEHFEERGSAVQSLGFSREAWSFDLEGRSEQLHLVFHPPARSHGKLGWTARAFYRVEGGELVEVDMDNGARRRHTAPWPLLDVLVRDVGPR